MAEKNGTTVVVDVEARELAEVKPGTDPNNWPHRHHILYVLDDGAKWAEVCERAIFYFNEASPGSRVHKLFLIIEFLNGFRRQQGLWPEEKASDLLDFAEKEIKSLPDDNPHRGRLLELLWFNGAEICHQTGQFQESANFHRDSAEATKDQVKRSLGLFNASREELNQKLYTGGSVGGALEAFRKMADKALGLLHPDVSEQRRWMANIYSDLIYFGWLARQGIDQADIVSFNDLVMGQESAFTDSIVLVRAIEKLVLENDAEAANEIGDKGLEGLSSYNYFEGVLLLMKAEAYARLGDRIAVQDAYLGIREAASQNHGHQLALAIAERKSKSFENQLD